ncbi:MAG TPA: S-methyl-5-thioribose-1-phosphate isomerase [Actinomycetota bacterium]|nr:S-methyl-5-thioribose-1-phosphate isomerase [Actinomycetota bacterium]
MARAGEPLVTALAWRGDHLEIIDQTALPAQLILLRLRTVAEVVAAIRRLAVRGAPALGVCGAFAMVLALDDQPPPTASAARERLALAASQVGAARPTAVNLSWAARRVAALAAGGDTPEAIRRLAVAEAERICAADRESCRRIGEAARAELAGASRLMTYCNAGRLASAGIGTALAVAYLKAEAGEPVSVLVCETRPLLQGARLTAWELAEAGIPVTLIPDGAAGAALAGGRAEAVIVGCDRVAANGDTANKIGTYGLATLARASGVPFYVAGPLASFDPDAATGADIVIEERPADEVRCLGGVPTAPHVTVWNPAFDVTPGGLITAFVTEAGVLRPPFGPAIAAALRTQR